MRNFLFTITVLSAFAGCDGIKFKDGTQTVAPVSADVKMIADSMEKVPVDTCKLMYKQFAGLVNYMEFAGGRITNTGQLEKVLVEFQTEYSYTREQYTDYSDAVDLFLKKRSYEDIKTIVTNVTDESKEKARTDVINDYRILAEGAKLAMERKNGK